MARQNRTVAHALAHMAARAHGVVTWAEMLRAGISEDEIRYRARVGSLIRVHRGLYRVGHAAPSVDAHYMAAVKACGPTAVLSGFAAAHLLSLLKGRPAAPEVTTTSERRVRGVITHRRRSIDPLDITIYRQIP